MLIEAAALQELILSMGLGLYMLVMALIFFIRADYYRSLIMRTEVPGIGIMLTASLGFLIAIFFVLLHNIWVFDPRVAVTIACWMFLLNAVAWLVAPTRMLDIAKKVCSGSCYYILTTILLIFAAQILMRGVYLYASHSGLLAALPS